MTVTDEDMSLLSSRVHELEVGARGQLDLTRYVLGRLGTIDEALVEHTKILVDMRQRQTSMEQTLAVLLAKVDALPALIASVVKPAND